MDCSWCPKVALYREGAHGACKAHRSKLRPEIKPTNRPAQPHDDYKPRYYKPALYRKVK